MAVVDVPGSVDQQRAPVAAPPAPAGPPPASGRPPRRFRSWSPGPSFRRLAGTVGLVLAVHLATRALTLAVLAAMASVRDVSPWSRLHKADGEWYLAMIQSGYQTWIEYRPDGSLVNTNIAFFPAYPMLSRAVSTVFRLSPYAAGLTVTAIAAMAASWLIYLIGRDLRGHRTGLMLVALWSAGPIAVVLSMVYTEALFTALAAGALLALLRRNWLAAGAACALAGLTRSSGVAVIAAVLVVALLAAVRREDGWRPYAAAALAPLGVLGYWGWAGWQLGRADGWFWMQREGWQMRYDFGVTTVGAATRALATDGRLVPTVCALLVAGSVVLWVFMLQARVPLPMAVYATVLLVVTLGTTNYLHAEPRFLLPAFPLLLPAAVLLARAADRVLAVVLPALALASAWFGAVLLVVWWGAL